MKISLILSLIFLISCSLKTNLRSPSSIEQTKLSLIVEEISLTCVLGLSKRACVLASKDFYNELYNLSYTSSMLKNISKPKELFKRSFYARLIIRNYLSRLDNDYFSKDCVNGLRDITRSLRYLEDYIIQRSFDAKVSSDLVFSNVQDQLQVNPKFDFESYEDLESGDVIISRGNAFTSAAIARIGVKDSQFSHMSFVYKDPDGKIYTTEAHIEIGSVATEFQNHIDQKNARAVVYRFKDQDLAHKAAKHMYLKVKNFSENNSNNINYDFGMDYKENEELFCSEVVYDGFNYASVGKIDIPRYKTNFDAKLTDFLNQLGIDVSKDNIALFDTFGPGDIEYDNRFELVAEWRNPKKIVNTRIKDAVLSKMFEWMSDRKYALKAGFKLSSKAYIAYFARRIPWVKNSFIEKFPLNMGPQQMKLFLVLDVVGESLEKEVISRKDFEKLSFKEMYNILESFREKDYGVAKRRGARKSEFHRYFRPW